MDTAQQEVQAGSTAHPKENQKNSQNQEEAHHANSIQIMINVMQQTQKDRAKNYTHGTELQIQKDI
jgi:hypothetical protein